MNECMMQCDPPEGGGDERFFVVVMEELTIYAHTVDAHTQARYPEDWPHTLRLREQGRDWLCWHSAWCTDGELAAGDVDGTAREITYEQFIEAREANWPTLLDEAITREGPVIAVGHVEADGTVVETWNSIEGNKAS